MDNHQPETMNPQERHSDVQSHRLTRSLSFFDVMCLGINSVVGAGIFLLPGQLCALAGDAALWVFPLCGILCFAIALCFAEMGGMHSGTGGAYLYAKDAFGPFTGFLVGWMMWLSSIIGWASVAGGFGLYLTYFLPAGNAWVCKGVIALLVTGLSVINFFGVKPGARTINFFTIGKLLSLLIFVGVGLLFIKGRNLTALHHSGRFNDAVIIALYAYSGFEYTVVPAGEMQRPQKDVPRVLFWVLTSVTLLYVAIQTVAMGVFPGLAASGKPLADAAQHFMGAAGGIIIGIGALLSIGGVNAGIALTSPRSLYALALDKFFPRTVSKIHPKYHTPYWAVAVTAALTLLLSLTGSFQYLVAACVMASILQYIPTCLAVIVLRRRRPHQEERGYRIPGGYFVPIVALIICVWLICHVDLKVIAATAVAVIAALPFYFWRRGK